MNTRKTRAVGTGQSPMAKPGSGAERADFMPSLPTRDASRARRASSEERTLTMLSRPTWA